MWSSLYESAGIHCLYIILCGGVVFWIYWRDRGAVWGSQLFWQILWELEITFSKGTLRPWSALACAPVRVLFWVSLTQYFFSFLWINSNWDSFSSSIDRWFFLQRRVGRESVFVLRTNCNTFLVCWQYCSLFWVWGWHLRDGLLLSLFFVNIIIRLFWWMIIPAIMSVCDVFVWL